jgi:hypothetical protein
VAKRLAWRCSNSIYLVREPNEVRLDRLTVLKAEIQERAAVMGRAGNAARIDQIKLCAKFIHPERHPA